MIETTVADPRLREQMWGAALLLPALPPLAIGLVLLTPPPVREVLMASAIAARADGAPLATAAASAVPPALSVSLSAAALAVIAVAGLLALARLGALLLRAGRLRDMIRTAGAVDATVAETVAAAAGRLAVPAPRAVMSDATPEPLLAGLGRPRLILPAHSTASADPAVVDAIITHELAHLKRGDHRAVWLEEAVLALLAANPLMPLLRARRAAAREEACDALALAGAGPETRRAYAQSLIEVLRSRAGPHVAGPLPALTFTGAERTIAMHRLKAVLTPAARAGRRARLAVALTGVSLLAAAGAASAVAAAQREPETRLVASPSTTTPQGPDRPSVVDRVPETARVGEVFRMRTPAGRVVDAWRGQPADRPGYVAPSGPVLQARLGQPEVPAGHVLVRGSVRQGAEQDQATGAFTAPGAPAHEVEVVAYGARNGQTPPPPPAGSRSRVRGQAGEPTQEVEVTAQGTRNRGAPPPPPALRPDRVRPRAPGAPAQEVEVEVIAHGTRNGAPPPPPLSARPGTPRNGQTRNAPPPPPPAARPRGTAASLRFDVQTERPIQVRDGDVLKVWVDGPFEPGARTTRTLSVPLATGRFQPVSTQIATPNLAPVG
jgi:beta-lactamase regulating signal transducer with metallopeptidase domain